MNQSRRTMRIAQETSRILSTRGGSLTRGRTFSRRFVQCSVGFGAFLLCGVTVMSMGGCGPRLVPTTRDLPNQPPTGGLNSSDLQIIDNTSAPRVGTNSGTIPSVSPAEVMRLPQTPPEVHYHDVQAGETLSGIARHYHTSEEELRNTNGLDPGTVLQPGQLLLIPNTAGTPASAGRASGRK